MPPSHAPALLDDEPGPLAFMLDPRGRVRRGAFWFGLAALFGLSVYLRFVLGIARARPELVDGLVSVLATWPLLALCARRWHDRGKSGWWALIVLLPVVGWIIGILVNGALRGDAGANRYGAAPEAAL